MNAIARFYNVIAPVYPIIAFFLKRGTKKLKDVMEVNEQALILDLGLGLPPSFLKSTPSKVIGIDISPRMLQQKQRWYHKGIIMDAQHLKFDEETFDIIVAAYVISVVPDPYLLLESAHRVLKSRGKLYILNHFSENKLFAFFDQLLQPVAKIFKFNICLKVKDLPLHQFDIVNVVKLGWLRNYRIIVLEKK